MTQARSQCAALRRLPPNSYSSFLDTNHCSGYDLADGVPGKVEGRCLSTVSPGMTLTYASTPYGDSTAWKTATTTLSRTSTVGAIGVVGWNIKLATPTRTSTSTSLGPDTTSATSIPSAISSATPSATSISSSGGLTTGAKAGIGVGVGVGGVGAIALFVALYKFLRRRKEAVPDTPVHYSQQQFSMAQEKLQQPPWPSELPGSTKYTPASPAELPPSPIFIRERI